MNFLYKSGISAALPTLLISIALSACSSDSGSAGPAPASYAGSTSQASITSSNSEEISRAMLDGSSGTSAVAGVSNNGQAEKKQLLGAVRSIHNIVRDSDKQPVSGGLSATAAATSYSNSITSSCGGSMSYTFTYDDVTGSFSGTYSFSAYVDCADNSRMDGSMTVSGSLNLTTIDVTSMTATFDALSYTDDSESMTMTGNMVYTILSATSMKATMNMDFRDNNKNESYRAENMIAIVTEDVLATYADMDLSGKFYHPVHGYITMTTTTLLHIVYPDENPRSGVIEIVGASGSKAVMTMTSNDTYTLQVDANGDTTFETTKSCTWSTNTCI